jgi:hypothetical protein
MIVGCADSRPARFAFEATSGGDTQQPGGPEGQEYAGDDPPEAGFRRLDAVTLGLAGHLPYPRTDIGGSCTDPVPITGTRGWAVIVTSSNGQVDVDGLARYEQLVQRGAEHAGDPARDRPAEACSRELRGIDERLYLTLHGLAASGDLIPPVRAMFLIHGETVVPSDGHAC